MIYSVRCCTVTTSTLRSMPPHSAFLPTGTYALIGAAGLLGGMGRMTIAGTVICLEACGNMVYLLPLMVTFAGARYAGKIFNLHIFISSYLHIFISSYLHIFISSYLHIFISSYIYIFCVFILWFDC